MNKVFQNSFFSFLRNLFSTKTGYQVLAFIIPFSPKLIPVAIIYLVISRIAELETFRGFKLKFSFHWVFIVFYLLHVIGVFYSQNSNEAYFDLQVKLSLLIFPLICITDKNLTSEVFKKVCVAFIEGCCVLAILCFASSIYQYYLSRDTSNFFYSSFSVFLHPSYLAMYLNLSLILVFNFYKNGVLRSIPQLIFFTLLFSVSILLSSSKAGIIFLILLVIYLLFYLFYKQNYKAALILLSLFIFSSFFIYKKVPAIAVRFQVMTDVIVGKKKAEQESNIARKEVWQAGTQIIKNNFILGVGTGDVKTTLLEEYDRLGYKSVAGKKLNAHNQYLQTFLGLGLAGFLILLITICYPLVCSYKEVFWIYFFFLILISFNFMFESVLETQAGVVFYSFFNTLMYKQLKFKRNSNDDKSE